MLDSLAGDKVKFCKDRQLKKSSVLKQLKNFEQSKQDSTKINFALIGPKEGGISYVLIPAATEYSQESRNSPSFDHTDVDTIWTRLKDPNWKKSLTGNVLITQMTTLNILLIFLKKHFGQSNGTLFMTQEWVQNLLTKDFQDRILKGELPSDISIPAAAEDILFSFKTDFSTLREVPFLLLGNNLFSLYRNLMRKHRHPHQPVTMDTINPSYRFLKICSKASLIYFVWLSPKALSKTDGKTLLQLYYAKNAKNLIFIGCAPFIS